MTFSIEIVLRGNSEAVTEQVHGSEPRGWEQGDVEAVLTQMLLSIDRARDPKAEHRHVALRGFSWIVEPSEGGVVIAIEIPSGAAVAGPFDIPQAKLDRLISSVLTPRRPSTRTTIH